MRKLKKIFYLKNFFPNVYSILNKEFYSQDEVSAIQLDGISEIKSYVIERQKDFEDRYGKVVNNSKLNYGIFRAFELMEEYEKQNNFKYDFVIRLRPDAKYITNLDLKRLNEVNNGELALKIFSLSKWHSKRFCRIWQKKYNGSLL